MAQGAQSLKSGMSVSATTGEAPMRGVIRGLVASSGSGCEAVLLSHSNSGQPPCWTTRCISLKASAPIQACSPWLPLWVA